jgi:20S proteasome subunit alpha 4
VAMLDDHICLAFAGPSSLHSALPSNLSILAGLTADARILIDKARIECQSHRLTVEDPVTVEYITRFIAGVQQKYTQSGGVRPFGISTLLVGFDANDPTPRLYTTEPSGIFSAWKVRGLSSFSLEIAGSFRTGQCDRSIQQDGARVP